MAPKEKISGNPIDVDEGLQEMIAKLDTIQAKRKFVRWKASFSNNFEQFLEKDGIENAKKDYSHFKESTETFAASCLKVQKAVDAGQISDSKVSVKGRNAINELNKAMAIEVEKLLKFIPTTGAEEKKSGYNKYQMGAVLIRDGFEIYGRMEMCREVLSHMKVTCLAGVADKQVIEAIDYYVQKFQNFCDLMADLQLYEIMKKCYQFAGDDSGVDPPVIFIDVETGSIGRLKRETVIEKGTITVELDKEGEDVIKEALTDPGAIDNLKEQIKQILQLE